MKSIYLNSKDKLEIANKIAETVSGKTALLFVPENSKINVKALIEVLNNLKIKYIGGIFPKVIHGNSIYDKGIVIDVIEDEIENFIVKNLNSKKYTIPYIELESNTKYCAYTFVDGLASNISHYLSELYTKYGNKLSYFGGGAGSLTLQQTPCVFNHTGLYQDAAVVSIAKVNSTIGVKHGWKKVRGPLIATKTDQNIIKEINWRSAFEVYSEIINQDSEVKIDANNFFNVAKGYPFGIVKQNAEHVVRDPISVNENGELICVGEVPENTVLDILKGENNSLINAAKQAAMDVSHNAKNPSYGVIIDCISRILFLEEEFQIELNGVVEALKTKNENLTVSGALTLGEVSSYGSNYLELFNKTLVVGLFENI